jgi:hypothetical protein
MERLSLVSGWDQDNRLSRRRSENGFNLAAPELARWLISRDRKHQCQVADSKTMTLRTRNMNGQ